jgi:protein arginine kinase
MNDNNSKFIKELRDSTAQWVKGYGPKNHIVVSSRIRLARNIKDIPFPVKASDKQLEIVLKKIEKIVKDKKDFANFKIIKIDKLSSIPRNFLIQKRLISIALASVDRLNSALIYDPEEINSIMINEEDHLRLQCMLPGFQLQKVWELINQYDNKIEEEVEYAFDELHGFLTCCPTNVGTGLRASAMLHLPALIILNRLNELLKSISNKGYAVRGFYGEGTDFQGNLFQISNQTTLGLREMEIIEKLESVVENLNNKEQEAREELMIKAKKKIEDQVMRSYGILTNARIISTSEAVNLLSNIRFGIEMGILVKIGYDTINRLMTIIQPGYLQLIKGKKMNQMERGEARADLVKELLI